MRNQTTVNEFILLGFIGTKRVEPLLFILFFITYTVAMVGNFIFITLVFCENSLHSPMYMFIANLSFLEIIFTTTVIPKMLFNFMSQRKSIAFHSCILQAYIYFSTGSTEFFLLAIMSFDRYLAICNPLRYAAIMSTHVCFQLIAASWMWGFFAVLPPTILVGQLPFCGPNSINHFFCDVDPVLKLACFDVKKIEIINFVNSALLLLGSLLVTSVSYIFIIATVLRIPSAKGRQKAFSTCASHLIVVTLFYGSSIFIYVQPQKNHSLDLNKVASILNTVITPLMNPFIYSLRNEKVKEALDHLVRRKIFPLN
ncbi:LOW QUALITY PROTEIN: olfactory receptor 6M1-like [Podarcis raffonei]|uniref:LOW QUALITY PROTEIN: olfactory receptor 6M1-like n=1 Tax=Podarcis raffonei TaxID=65483 RepID=UPI00232924ED|nr:LOW QUALITY PROTEIN: olfactory receptor 6M1-like [Podarcis raffonei]